MDVHTSALCVGGMTAMKKHGEGAPLVSTRITYVGRCVDHVSVMGVQERAHVLSVCRWHDCHVE